MCQMQRGGSPHCDARKKKGTRDSSQKITNTLCLEPWSGSRKIYSWLRFILNPSLEQLCPWYGLAELSRSSRDKAHCLHEESVEENVMDSFSPRGESPLKERSLPLKRHGAGDCTRTIKGRTVAVCYDCPIRLYQIIGRKKSEAIGNITKKFWWLVMRTKKKRSRSILSRYCVSIAEGWHGTSNSF